MGNSFIYIPNQINYPNNSLWCNTGFLILIQSAQYIVKPKVTTIKIDNDRNASLKRYARPPMKF